MRGCDSNSSFRISVLLVQYFSLDMRWEFLEKLNLHCKRITSSLWRLPYGILSNIKIEAATLSKKSACKFGNGRRSVWEDSTISQHVGEVTCACCLDHDSFSWHSYNVVWCSDSWWQRCRILTSSLWEQPYGRISSKIIQAELLCQKSFSLKDFQR